MPVPEKPDNGWFQRYTVEKLDRLEETLDRVEKRQISHGSRLLVLETKKKFQATVWGSIGGVFTSILIGLSVWLITGG